MNWKPIELYDYENCPEVKLAAFVVSSQTAKNNGAKDFWHVQKGFCWSTKTQSFTSILGGKARYFMELQ